jgi:hypothetical protein
MMSIRAEDLNTMGVVRLVEAIMKPCHCETHTPKVRPNPNTKALAWHDTWGICLANPLNREPIKEAYAPDR